MNPKKKFLIPLLSCVLLVLCVPIAQGGKVKSSQHYLKKLDQAIAPVAADLQTTQDFLKTSLATGSFLTTSFWGIKPYWYLSQSDARPTLSNSNPFTNHLINHYGPWEMYPSSAVRNINGVILTPVKGPRERVDNSWRERLPLKINVLGGYQNIRYFSDWTKRDFEKSGVPGNKIEDAWGAFLTKVSPGVEKITATIYQKYDTLYGGFVQNGEYRVYEAIGKYLEKKGQLNIKDLISPVRHENLFTEELFTQVEIPLHINSFKQFYFAVTDTKKKEKSIEDFYAVFDGLSLTISVQAQYFVVAQNLDKSMRFNQLKKLEEMLEQKVEKGLAVKINDKRYTIYEDATSAGKYKGRLAINFETGEGYWQQGVVSAHDDVKALQASLKKNCKMLQKVLMEYYALCAKETAKEFGQQGAKTSDF